MNSFYLFDMEHLDIATRAELVAYYFESGRSAVQCLRRYKNEHGTKVFICTEGAIRKVVDRFLSTWSVADFPKSGRPRVPVEKVEQVSEVVTQLQYENPSGTASTSEISRAVGMPKSTVWKILREYLNWHPYRLRLLQELKTTDPEKRQNFSAWMLRKIEYHPKFVSSVWWSHESTFCLDGDVYASGHHLVSAKSLQVC
jgi:hypothetical protein